MSIEEKCVEDYYNRLVEQNGLSSFFKPCDSDRVVSNYLRTEKDLPMMLEMPEEINDGSDVYINLMAPNSEESPEIIIRDLKYLVEKRDMLKSRGYSGSHVTCIKIRIHD